MTSATSGAAPSFPDAARQGRDLTVAVGLAARCDGRAVGVGSGLVTLGTAGATGATRGGGGVGVGVGAVPASVRGRSRITAASVGSGVG